MAPRMSNAAGVLPPGWTADKTTDLLEFLNREVRAGLIARDTILRDGGKLDEAYAMYDAQARNVKDAPLPGGGGPFQPHRHRKSGRAALAAGENHPGGADLVGGGLRGGGVEGRGGRADPHVAGLRRAGRHVDSEGLPPGADGRH